ncbi:hypothetical protein RFI_00658 [Reticulomyxa filosa]|uniref:Ribonuclease n=1 Tax=Reticulomyxa filosa TaxID=46433 RepID=X6PD62_RETFI|nr:hypothetical protein RFI_00658 [Reticulomyxa filosa]|eukprot:ETO36405.1 hypothetical protein RFI_00658 [Reticulomyxa filosa]
MCVYVFCKNFLFFLFKLQMIGMRDSVTELMEKLKKSDSSRESGNEEHKHMADAPITVLVDGNRDPCYEQKNIKCRLVVRGDAQVYCIAAASIIAKVTRDRMMVEYHKKWPLYGFDQHKGYPSPAHQKAVWKYGPCPIHRRSFNPVKKYVEEHPESAPYGD